MRWLQDATYMHVVVDEISGGASQNGSWAVSFPRQRGGFTTAQCRGPPGACTLALAHPCVRGSGHLLRAGTVPKVTLPVMAPALVVYKSDAF